MIVSLSLLVKNLALFCTILGGVCSMKSPKSNKMYFKKMTMNSEGLPEEHLLCVVPPESDVSPNKHSQFDSLSKLLKKADINFRADKLARLGSTKPGLSSRVAASAPVPLYEETVKSPLFYNYELFKYWFKFMDVRCSKLEFNHIAIFIYLFSTHFLSLIDPSQVPLSPSLFTIDKMKLSLRDIYVASNQLDEKLRK